MGLFSLASLCSCFSSSSIFVKYLSKDVLDQATEVVLRRSSGALAPEYHWDECYRVTQDSIHVLVRGSYGSQVLADNGIAITSEQYTRFVKQLLDYGIGESKKKVEPTSGGKTIVFEVLKGETSTFKAANDLLVVDQGDLLNPFTELMSQEMIDSLH